MLCKDIIHLIEDTYPTQAAMEWDNVGLLVGRSEKQVKTICVALDVTEEVIDEAIAKGVDMLITHHPLLFSPVKTITDETLIGNRVVKLLQHDISYYAMHTNYDVFRMAGLSAELLGLERKEVLDVTTEDGVGIGMVGELPDFITLSTCCELIKDKFQLQGVKVFGDLATPVKRVAISPGSGKHMSELAVAKGADVFVTGDIDHHEGLDAVSEGMAIVDAGHYGLEHIFIKDIAHFLAEKANEIDVLEAEVKHPFQFV